MDFDTISNFSGHSNQSDDVRSNESTLSGLSTYVNEFAELRHLINPLKYSTPVFERSLTPKQAECDLSYEDRISTLTFQLQNSLKLNEKYKNDLFNLEQTISLKFNERIEKLLKSNNQFKSEVQVANEQIDRLLRNFSSRNEKYSETEKLCLQLEEKCYKLSLQNSSYQFDLFELKNRKSEYEVENKQTKNELEEIKIDINAKTFCIQKLKEKIKDQHVEIQMLTKNDLLVSQKIQEVLSELDHVKKLHKWYKDQLYMCQNNRQMVHNETMEYKNTISLKDEEIDILKLEIAKWKHQCDMLQLETLKQKEELCKQTESNFKITLNDDTPKCNSTEDNIPISYYEMSIQDLTGEISKIKEFVQEQDIVLKRITKENAELTARNVTLQKTIQQKEINIEELENSRNILNIELNLTKDNVTQKSEELLSIKNKIANLEAELIIRHEEKELVEDVVKTIREQFSHFKSKYEELKEDLLCKNKQILQLQNEKQKLFMENNWNICELEKLKEKEVIITNLKLKLAEIEQQVNEYLNKIKQLENVIKEKEDKCKDILDEKQVVINNNSLEFQKYENVFVQYKDMVTNYENQVNDLQNELKENKNNIVDLEDNVNILKDEIKKKDLDLSKMNNNYFTLENSLKTLINEKENMLKSNNIDPLNSVQNSCNHCAFLGTLQQFMEFYKTRNVSDNLVKSYTDSKTDININIILEKINKYFQNINVADANGKITKFQQSKSSLKGYFYKKLVKLENRIDMLQKKSDDYCKTMRGFFDDKDSVVECKRIHELKVLLKVKEMELREKQKRYEVNYRTLLRKVKEHMKGRNSAEKQNKYLQDLYNSLSDENNSLKLSVSSKDYEIESMKKLLQRHCSINDKLKQTVLQLEDAVKKNSSCDQCLDYKRLKLLEESYNKSQDEKIHLQKILCNKDDIISSLQNEIQDLLSKNSILTSEMNTSLKRIDEILCEKQKMEVTLSNLQKQLDEKLSLIDELKFSLMKETEKYAEGSKKNIFLNKHLDEANDKVLYLSNEIKIVNSTLQSKSEELNEMENKRSKIENDWTKKIQNAQNIIVTLKTHLHDSQTEIMSINSEKYFLQRLCNDLKLALKTHVVQNKKLKEQLNLYLSKEKQEFNSLPNILPDLPSPSKLDELYINQLLQEIRTPVQDRPIIDIQGCLDTLRKEVMNLQQEIVKKNIHIS